jgi:NAD(P)-dependent dehydrogenase (short-subunit alcohol dehydrogenase family)
LSEIHLVFGANMANSGERVVLITGASSGIGQACATYLAQRGYRVLGTSRQAAFLPATLEWQPGSVQMIPMDVNEDDSVQRAIVWAVGQAGRIDVLVNCAGYGIVGAVEDTTVEDAKAQIETNLFGVWRTCRAVLPAMRAQRGGYIVNISSIGGLIGIPFQSAYGASKFAVEGLTEALSAEVKPFGIHACLIEPGDIPTQFAAHRHKTAECLQNRAYCGAVDRALAVMEHDEQQGPSPMVVARQLERIITNPAPRLRYTVGPLFEKLAVLAKRILPGRLFERILMANYKLGGG